MNKFSLLAAVGLLAASITSAISAPLLRYEFDQTGATQSSTGSAALDLTVTDWSAGSADYITAVPVPRGGGVGYALNFTSQNIDTGLPAGNQTKGVAKAALNDTNAGFLRSGLNSFTISAWVLNVQMDGSDPNNNARRLFSLRNTSGQQVVDFILKGGTDNTNVLQLGLTGSQGQRTMTSGSMTLPMNSNEWYFVSISYDATTGDVNFYLGEEGGTLGTVAASNIINGEINTLLTNATILGVGNVDYNHQRRLDGYLSDVRFYDSALTAEQIGQIHAIPEPGTTALLGFGILTGGLLLRKRSRKLTVA